MSVNNYGNGGVQPISITQPLLYTGIFAFQIFNDLPNRISLYGNRLLPIRKLTQQGWNPNDWQMIIPFVY
jgi:hypothetical protein